MSRKEKQTNLAAKLLEFNLTIELEKLKRQNHASKVLPLHATSPQSPSQNTDSEADLNKKKAA